MTITFFCSCSTRMEKDFSELDELNIITDSLLNLLQVNFEKSSENLYMISDDSLKRDSLIEVLNLPDTIGFYQYIEKNLHELNEIVFHIQQEIYFAKDQINSIKSEYQGNDISESEYIEEISDLHEVIHFLEERVDSNLNIIKLNSHFYTVPKDSLN